MAIELEKNYNPKDVEDKIYKEWLDSGFFNPDNLDLPETAPSYTIVLPPPNITDKLHVGHASTLAIEDLLIRFHRMNGYRALWIPGTDHAAIATQNAVEKKIFREEGKTRHDLGREVFLGRLNDFVKVTQATILNQSARMGSSMDWSRLAFTLDEPRQKAVQAMFLKMYEQGAIYRGERIVNWCPRCKSTLADDEVEYKEQAAKFYTFKYSADFPMAISTTRPETKLGDTAVAVNPKDERYKQYIGQTFAVDFCGVPLNIKVIADRNVEMEFGTGALGVTPAHSMVDWQMAQTNDLPVIKVIDENANIREGFGRFSGMTAMEARAAVVADLNAAGLMIKEDEIANNLSVCYRCDTGIEPLPSKQWFVAVDKPLANMNGQSLKQAAIAAAEKGDIKFIPDRFNKRYLDWMNNLRDWCISRQIWFGHRIPVWYKGEEIYVGENAPEGSDWTQDPDTLDTWFSSGMWTFSTLGWPDNMEMVDGKMVKKGDLLKFHPTQVLETGYEILTLWVSRMIMMSLFAVGEIPFSDVYLHGMVLDKNGKKMSKSKGNGVDPLDVIATAGADALRLSLMVGSTPGNDTRFSEERLESAKNFVNKLWNISRYVLSGVEDIRAVGEINSAELTVADAWILSRLNKTITDFSERITRYEFSLAGETLRDFTLNDLADWYLEASKFDNSAQKNPVLIHALKTILKLWHPFMPFITENIWSYLGEEKMLLVSAWPIADNTLINDEAENNFALVRDLIVAIRNARSENKIEPATKVKALMFAGDKTELLKTQSAIISSLRTGLSEIEFVGEAQKIADAIFVSVAGVEIYLLGGIDKDKERERLNKEKENLSKLITNLSGRLANEEFVARAPEKIVAAEKEKLANWQSDLEKIEEKLKTL
ncbi:MAG: valine--tRNA ligase [Candidatus Falkowbacteria bacterium]